MTFNTALTGLRAATTDLNVTGNNIANASTTGFKQSRVEFADVYASSVEGGGANAVGNGVRVSDVAQQFSQGNISFTESSLDLAINGGGFFVISDQGSQLFTRAGQFGVDDQGFVVTNDGARLQGFPSNAGGSASNVLGDLALTTADIAPRQTTLADMLFNLNADSQAPEIIVQSGPVSGTLGQAVLAGTNSYLAGTIDIDGTNYPIPALDNDSARTIAVALSAVPGVSASASTSADLQITSGFPVAATQVRVNGVEISGTLAQMTTAINAIGGLTATDDGTDTITVVSDTGEDVVFEAIGAGFGANVSGAGAAVAIASAGPTQATVGGIIDLTVDFGTVITPGVPAPVGPGIVVMDAPPTLSTVTSNQFDPGDSTTFNDSNSVTIFDSLGARHILTQYFVKENQVTSAPNTWTMYVQIDGQDVGDPDPANPGVPTLASFSLTFFNDGSLDSANTDELVISNWTPLDADGNPAGALGPLNGASAPIPEPPTSSNFLIDILGSTQFSGGFSVNELSQNGFARGRLTSVDISGTGIIFARYSNGEALTLGQVALASFPNQQGLSPLGNTSWAETFESGQPVIGAPRTASLGSITSGALEDSNVELAEELVALIIAQRNFQANSRTIETANEIQQTVINIR